jgi:hypothetical protein
MFKVQISISQTKLKKFLPTWFERKLCPIIVTLHINGVLQREEVYGTWHITDFESLTYPTSSVLSCFIQLKQRLQFIIQP